MSDVAAELFARAGLSAVHVACASYLLVHGTGWVTLVSIWPLMVGAALMIGFVNQAASKKPVQPTRDRLNPLEEEEP